MGEQASLMASTPTRSPVLTLRNPTRAPASRVSTRAIAYVVRLSGTHPSSGLSVVGKSPREASKSHARVTFLSQASHWRVEGSGQLRRTDPTGALVHPLSVGREYEE